MAAGLATSKEETIVNVSSCIRAHYDHYVTLCVRPPVTPIYLADVL